jgi:hypothetical protein
VKIVFLHGIGEGDPDYRWLNGLNRGLEQAGHPIVERDQVITPRYSELLKGLRLEDAKLPPLTYKLKDDGIPRREFERRQARVQRFLRLEDGVRAFGFHLLDPVVGTMPGYFIDHVSVQNLPQVRRYVREERIRANVMKRILDYLPTHGDIMLIAHSLGSVVAIDLLDHLSTDLHVRRFITIGSPAAIRAVHEGSERLLKKFPYGRVDDWSNFLNVRDPVTGARGLANTFPGAQDFMLSNISGHGADVYLGDPAVAKLIAHTLYPTKTVVRAGNDIAVRMSDAEASTLLLQHFAEAVVNNIKDEERATRFRATLRILRDDLAAQLEQNAAAGQLLSPQMIDVINGKLPRLPHRWELHEAVGEMVVLALTNCVAPYEIDPGDAQRKALNDIAVELGLTRSVGDKVADAIKEVRERVAGKSGVPWGRVLTAAAGLALIAAGPVGLAVAAPAGAFGGAAIVGGLAAFGPGGMVGGLAMLGGLAGAGAAAGAAAAMGGGANPEAGVNSLEKLLMRISAEYARKKLGLPFDTTLWFHLTDYEGQLSAVLNRLKAFSDEKAPRIVQLSAAQVAVHQLVRFMVEKGLAPKGITDGEVKALEA